MEPHLIDKFIAYISTCTLVFTRVNCNNFNLSASCYLKDSNWFNHYEEYYSPMVQTFLKNQTLEWFENEPQAVKHALVDNRDEYLGIPKYVLEYLKKQRLKEYEEEYCADKGDGCDWRHFCWEFRHNICENVQDEKGKWNDWLILMDIELEVRPLLNKTWEEYAKGFGGQITTTDRFGLVQYYFAGFKKIGVVEMSTAQEGLELRLEIVRTEQVVEGYSRIPMIHNKIVVHYDDVKFGDESTRWRLEVSGFNQGKSDGKNEEFDVLTCRYRGNDDEEEEEDVVGHSFTTADSYDDSCFIDGTPCAKVHQSGWWWTLREGLFISHRSVVETIEEFTSAESNYTKFAPNIGQMRTCKPNDAGRNYYIRHLKMLVRPKSYDI